MMTKTDKAINAQDRKRAEERLKLLEGPDKVLGRIEAAAFLEISTSTLDTLIKKCRIPSTFIEGRRVFSMYRLNALNPESAPEVEEQIWEQRRLETAFKDAAFAALASLDKHVALLKRTIGNAVDKRELWEAMDNLGETEKAADVALRELNKFAGLGWLDPEPDIEIKPGPGVEKVCTGYTEVANECGGTTRTPTYEFRKIDYSNQIEIVNIQQSDSRGSKR